MSSARLNDALIAIGTTLVGAALAWGLAGGLPAIGIDDSAITRSYSQNLAAGAGYVYNVGGERVEGSTTLLWTLILTLFYAVSDRPEPAILLLGAALATGAVYCALRVARHLSAAEGGEPGVAVAVVAAVLVASPGYFLWSVWTMMEVGIWSAAILLLTFGLVRAATGPAAVDGTARSGSLTTLALAIPAICLPMIRPEGVAVAIGLLALGAVLVPAVRTRAIVCVGLALAVFAAITVWRLSYFGQPFPNTFYAKVSSDRVQDAIDGTKYTLRFVFGQPFAEAFVLAWLAAVALVALRLRDAGGPARTAPLIPAAAVFGVMAVYSALGGDHFALWRFIQPIQPLLPVALAVWLSTVLTPVLLTRSRRALLWPAGAVAAGLLVLGPLHYYQARFDVAKEFVLTERGLDFGAYLNGIEPAPSIGVGAAGGIAMAYDGYIYDLHGLNWTEMAHAKPVKVGLRNHASFHAPTFWENRPDLVAIFNKRCPDGELHRFWTPFDGLFDQPRFRAEFTPVVFRQDGACWPGFAHADWMARLDETSVEVLAWPDADLAD